MIQVKKNVKIENVTKVVSEISPSFSGIAAQECKGRLWVDRIEAPQLAVIESSAVGGFAILGSCEADEVLLDLKNFLETELFNQQKSSGYDSFEFSIETEDKSMQNKIIDLFRDKTIHTEKEFSFRIHTTPDLHPCIPTEYQIRKVDSAFWKLLLEEYENEDFIKVRLLESWDSFEDFESKSIAYCTIFDQRIVAVMIGTASFHRILAIDIETEEKHRNKGLAFAMAAEFLADCLKHNYIPQWDCVESNPGSYHLAQKLGFEKVRENTVYWFSF